MQTSTFSVEILLDTGGVRSVRVLGEDWSQSAAAHALLQRLSPLIQELDAVARQDASREKFGKGGIVQ